MDEMEIIKFLQKPIGKLFEGADLFVPKSVNEIVKWFDAEQVPYERFETGEFHQDGQTPLVGVRLKGVPESHQEWALTRILSAITMKYYFLNNVSNETECPKDKCRHYDEDKWSDGCPYEACVRGGHDYFEAKE